MGFYRYVGKRCMQMIPTFFLTTAVVFLLLGMAPGSPAQIMLGMTASPDEVRILEHKLGLDRPLHVRYFEWLSNLLRFDLGRSYTYSREPVARLIADRISITIELALLSMIVVVVLAIPMAVISVRYHNRLPDHFARVFSLLGQSIPNFWIGITLVFVFGVYFQVIPVLGFVPITEDVLGNLVSMAMPSLALGTSAVCYVSRMLRSNLLDVVNKDYISLMRSYGIPEQEILRKWALKNAFIPTLSVIGYLIGLLLGGSVVIERVFYLHGIGSLLVDAVLQRDYIVVQGVITFMIFAFMISNLIVDILIGYFDPRVSYEEVQ